MVAYLYYRRKTRGITFPTLDKNEILYVEKTASGRSMKNFMTQYGGARNTLKVVVTPNELWLTSWFPFSLLIEIFDLEHRINKEDIINIEQEDKVFRVTFKTQDELEKTVEILPKKIQEFEVVIANMKRA